MKKLLTAALAVSLVVPGIALAQPGPGPDRHEGWHDHDRRGPEWRGPARPEGPPAGWRQFHRGERFDQGRAWRYERIDYRGYHRLRPPPRGYYWARNGDDAVLVGITSGIVASVLIGALR